MGRILFYLFSLACFVGVFLRIQHLELWRVIGRLLAREDYAWRRLAEVMGWGVIFLLAVAWMSYKERRRG